MASAAFETIENVELYRATKVKFLHLENRRSRTKSTPRGEIHEYPDAGEFILNETAFDSFLLSLLMQIGEESIASSPYGCEISMIRSVNRISKGERKTVTLCSAKAEWGSVFHFLPLEAGQTGTNGVGTKLSLSLSTGITNHSYCKTRWAWFGKLSFSIEILSDF